MLRWGIPGDPIGFTIGIDQVVGGKTKLKVVAIVKELTDEGGISHHIQCVRPEKPEEPFVWKTYHRMPDETVYCMPDDKHNYKLV